MALSCDESSMSSPGRDVCMRSVPNGASIVALGTVSTA